MQNSCAVLPAYWGRAFLWGVVFLMVFAGCSSDQSADGERPGAGPALPADPSELAHWSQVPAQDPPLNLILISIDTTRRDRLSCYGFEKETTPNLDRLSKEGIRFDRAASPVPLTLPSHATMLTGLYPFEHGVRHNGAFSLADSLLTLGEMLKQRGYDTGMIAGAFPLDHRFGLDQGFDHYDDRFSALSRRNSGDTAQRPAADVTRLSLQWLDERGDAPFFLWAHYFDPHAPYRPPEPYRSRFPGDAYAGEVAYMDAEIGKLIDGLRSRDMMQDSIILVAGDHGEGLGDHDELTHSTFIYHSTQRIPMIFWFPKSGAFDGKIWRDREIPELTSLCDLLPTAWNALGFEREALPPVTGKSLLPLIEGRGSGHDWLYHETLAPDFDFGLSELRGLETVSWKYIRAPRPELYNLEDDPEERRNLASKHSDRVAEMEVSLAKILAAEFGTADPVAMDEETIEKLRSLGYLGGASTSAGDRDMLADPKDNAQVGMVAARAQFLAENHRTTEAVAVLDSLLRHHPRMRQALRLRALYLVELNRGEEAIEAYDRALADCDGCPYERQLLQERAMAFVAAGKADQAQSQVETLLRQYPEEQGLHELLGEIFQEKGNSQGAREEFTAEAELFPLEAQPLLKLGMLEKSLNRQSQAEQALRRALQVDPEHVDALVVLSELLWSTGRRPEANSLLDCALAVDARHPGALFRKGTALRAEGRNGDAITRYRAALEAAPDNGVVWFHLATLYGQMGQNQQATECYEAAIETGSAPVGAFSNLGVMRAQAGRLPEAVQLWEQALAIDPNGKDAPAIRDNLSRARTMMNQK